MVSDYPSIQNLTSTLSELWNMPQIAFTVPIRFLVQPFQEIRLTAACFQDDRALDILRIHGFVRDFGIRFQHDHRPSYSRKFRSCLCGAPRQPASSYYEHVGRVILFDCDTYPVRCLVAVILWHRIVETANVMDRQDPTVDGVCSWRSIVHRSDTVGACSKETPH